MHFVTNDTCTSWISPVSWSCNEPSEADGADNTWRLPVRTPQISVDRFVHGLTSWFSKVRSVQPGVSCEKQRSRQQIKRNVKINWESPTTNWCGSKPNAGTAQTFFFYSQFIERSISSLTSLEGKAHLDINLDYGWDGIFLLYQLTESIPALESRWQIHYIAAMVVHLRISCLC